MVNRNIFNEANKNETLKTFYDKVQPMGNWSLFKKHEENSTFGYAILSWLLAIVFTMDFILDW
ncbi:MAG: hypothetical protein R2728_11225 [Chitinophagales bacterium]